MRYWPFCSRMAAERRIDPLFILMAVMLALGACATPGAITARLAAPTATPPAATALLPAASTTAPNPPTEPATHPPEPTAPLAAPAAANPTPAATPAPDIPPAVVAIGEPMVIGYSFGGRPLEVYRFGQGETPVVLVGGIHGGYEANSVELARRFIDYFRAGAALPSQITLHIVPDANPDGSALTAAAVAANPTADALSGRFNGRGVDLNRNWDCLWSPVAFWRDQPISGGSAPFSEPETQALRDYLIAAGPALVVFFHSAAGAIYGSGCPESDPVGLAWADIYGQASGYPVYPIFDHYAITGDASDWLSTQGIASFTVELTDHEDIEWERNLAGAAAVIAAVAPSPLLEPPRHTPE